MKRLKIGSWIVSFMFKKSQLLLCASLVTFSSIVQASDEEKKQDTSNKNQVNVLTQNQIEKVELTDQEINDQINFFLKIKSERNEEKEKKAIELIKHEIFSLIPESDINDVEKFLEILHAIYNKSDCKDEDIFKWVQFASPLSLSYMDKYPFEWIREEENKFLNKQNPQTINEYFSRFLWITLDMTRCLFSSFKEEWTAISDKSKGRTFSFLLAQDEPYLLTKNNSIIQSQSVLNKLNDRINNYLIPFFHRLKIIDDKFDKMEGEQNILDQIKRVNVTKSANKSK